MLKHRFVLAALVFLPAVSSSGQSAPKPQWVGTWAAASMLADGPLYTRMLSGVTLRQIAHISEWGLKQIIDAAHEHGIKAIGSTVMPIGRNRTDKDEQVRESVNNWIRTSGAFDAVVAFDKVTRDPAKPTQLNANYDSGDHVHPNDAGYPSVMR